MDRRSFFVSVLGLLLCRNMPRIFYPKYTIYMSPDALKDICAWGKDSISKQTRFELYKNHTIKGIFISNKDVI